MNTATPVTPTPISPNGTAPIDESTAPANAAEPDIGTATRRVRWRNVAKGEWIKFRSVRSTKLTLLAAGIVTVAFGMIFSATATSEEATGPAAALTDPVQLALASVDLTAMIIGVLGVLIIAGEYATGLIRTTIAAVGNRLKVLSAKAGVLAGAIAAVMSVATLLALWLGQAVYSGDLPTMAITDPDTIGVVLGTTFYVVGIGLIGLALGAILRSTAAAIGVLVGGVFIGPQLLTLLPEGFTDAVLKYLPSEAGSAMMSTVSDPDLLSTGAAYAVFAAWVVGLLATAGVLMRKRDA